MALDLLDCLERIRGLHVAEPPAAVRGRGSDRHHGQSGVMRLRQVDGFGQSLVGVRGTVDRNEEPVEHDLSSVA